MAKNGANPFLFEDSSPLEQQHVSNPFLMEEDYSFGNDVENDNPFLSQSAATVASNSTNPFAFDPMDLGPAEAEPATSYDQDIMSIVDTTMTVAPQKPTDLNLTYTNTVDSTVNSFSMNFLKEEETGNQKQPPRRPPPPPSSTSKETQDLLMSVMGAMDATSTHLLDRIPPTRTPSPVSMKDLHSQCPTPEPTTYEDLLGVDEPKMQESENLGNEKQDLIFQSQDLLSLDENKTADLNQNQVADETTEQIQVKPKPPRPEPPKKQVPPPKPPPPSKPPLPAFASGSETIKEKIQQEPVSKEEPSEMIDMFGDNISIPQNIQKPIASKQDILSLYNKAPPAPQPVASTQQIDLLSDVMDMDMKSDVIQDPTVPIQEPTAPVQENMKLTNTVENDFLQSDTLLDSKPFLVIDEAKTMEVSETETVQENFISPERSASDIHVDASDSQSRGSISSTTFNPFMATEDDTPTQTKGQQPDILAGNAFTASTNEILEPTSKINDVFNDFNQNRKPEDEFDAFTAKFESVTKDENKNGVFDAFSGKADAWGTNSEANLDGTGGGFENEEPFDSFLTLQEPPQVPQSTPNKMSKAPSRDSDEEKDFSVFIRPKNEETFSNEAMPSIAPPPSNLNAFSETSPRFNPFDQQTTTTDSFAQEPALVFDEAKITRSETGETPPTPLFDEDVSQPLEPFPRTIFTQGGWEMHLRQPNKKKITGQRFWKKIFVTLQHQNDCVLLQLYNQKGDKDPFQELPLQPCYSVSEIGAQQYDQYGKIFTIKLQYIFYKERPGVRPGQVKKAERITNKLSQFASYAIQGDYQGVKEFGSDLKKLGLPVEHAPQVSQLMKLGSLNYEDLKQFSVSIEEALFRLSAHRDRALHYKMEEVQVTAVDELYVDQDAEGHVEKQIARVRLFFLGFLTGMPDIELGVNDLRRQGKEVVGRHDIIPVVTEEWIRLEDVEFHSCVQQDEYENSHIIKFKPPDACYIELMRFRIRPPKNRELPLQLKASINVTGNKVTLKADVLVPGFASRKLGQVPCEDVMIRYPIPECWIYLFRVEKHFRYGSVKSAHRRTGKIKGIERILGTVDNLQESLIEVTSGQAKYEHQHRAVVWRCPRLPKEGQGAYTTHNMICRLALTSFDQIPDQLPEYCYVEFTMPATQVSHTTVRSVSVQNSDSDEPPEKYVRYLARHEYKVGIEHTEGESQAAYEVVTAVKPAPAVQEEPAPINEESDSDDSD